MDENDIKKKIKQLEQRKKDKLINIEQAERIIAGLRVDIIGIDGALREIKIMLDEQEEK